MYARGKSSLCWQRRRQGGGASTRAADNRVFLKKQAALTYGVGLGPAVYSDSVISTLSA